MAADNPANLEWLAALRDPVLGELRLSPCIIAPKHVPDVLKAFGPREPPARRWIVGQLDEMSINYWVANKRKPPVAFTAASDLLDRLDTSIENTLALWKQATPLHQAIFMAQFLRLPAKERKNYNHVAWEALNPVPPLTHVQPLIKALNDQNIYRDAFSQPPTADSHKSLTRALLWEPLLNLMKDFRQFDFSEHEPLIDTIRSLHLAFGIEPPDGRAVRQTVSAWKQRWR
jgi:hypothetical protein